MEYEMDFYLPIGGLSLSESEFSPKALLVSKLSNATESKSIEEGLNYNL